MDTGMSMSTEPTLTWNLAHDVSEVLEYHFMVNALLAGTIVAAMAGLLGWFMVIRSETFAGHTLAMMAFPGAAGAALVGVGAAWGYFVFCGAGALAIGSASGGRARSWSERSASIGAVQALALALGFLFVSLYGGVLGDLENLLFGTVLGVSDGQVLTLAAVAIGSLIALAALGRPLLLASVDPELADAKGVPVRRLSIVFLALLGPAVAATSQITGVLLVFALLLAPAATAQVLTARPGLSLVLSVAIGVAIVWVGLGVSYFSTYPAGFYVASIAFVLYVLARAWALARVAFSRRRAAPGHEPPEAVRPPAEGVIA